MVGSSNNILLSEPQRSPSVGNSGILSPKAGNNLFNSGGNPFRGQRRSAAHIRVDAEQEINQLEDDLLKNIQRKAVSRTKEALNAVRKLEPIVPNTGTTSPTLNSRNKPLGNKTFDDAASLRSGKSGKSGKSTKSGRRLARKKKKSKRTKAPFPEDNFGEAINA